jgi:hypothetical protein
MDVTDVWKSMLIIFIEILFFRVRKQGRLDQGLSQEDLDTLPISGGMPRLSCLLPFIGYFYTFLQDVF